MQNRLNTAVNGFSACLLLLLATTSASANQVLVSAREIKRDVTIFGEEAPMDNLLPQVLKAVKSFCGIQIAGKRHCLLRAPQSIPCSLHAIAKHLSLLETHLFLKKAKKNTGL